MIKVQLADRVKNLPPYLFASIDRMKQETVSRGVDLIDLSIGDPDIPTPGHIIDAMKSAVDNPEYHRYPSYEGMLLFREAVAGWYGKRFNVDLDMKEEVISLIGSKEGIGHIPLAFINPGDVVLVPSPGYPVYPVGTVFAEGEPYMMPLREENDFLPDLGVIPDSVCKRAKLMFLNYPNNPTAAVGRRDFFEMAISFAEKHNIIICHDAAYSEIYYNGKRPLSFLELDGAKEVGIEFHSLSKTYNMTGWRIGFAVGNRDVIAGLGKIKTNLDSGVFQAIQEAGAAALKTSENILSWIRNTYQERRDILFDGLTGLGFQLKRPEATFYIWTKVPSGFNSTVFAAHLLEKTGVLVTPGSALARPERGIYVLHSPSQRKDLKRHWTG